MESKEDLFFDQENNYNENEKRELYFTDNLNLVAALRVEKIKPKYYNKKSNKNNILQFVFEKNKDFEKILDEQLFQENSYYHRFNYYDKVKKEMKEIATVEIAKKENKN